MRIFSCAECGAFVAAGSNSLRAEAVQHGLHAGATLIELPEVDYSVDVNKWIVANVRLSAREMANGLVRIPEFAHVEISSVDELPVESTDPEN